MTADWTTCRVVRDSEDLLWTNAYDENLADSGGWWASVIGSHTGEALESWRGPLTPILDADGLPVVRTVGDLTARHVGKRVRIDGWFKGRLSNLGWAVDPSEIDLTAVDDGEFQYGLIPLDTPCEVLDA